MNCSQEHKSAQQININPNEINAIKLHNDLSSIKKINLSEQDEYTRFTEKLKVFDSVKSFDEAKAAAKKFLPMNDEINYLVVGNAKCAIISRRNLFRIVLNSDKNVICYNFRTEEINDDRH